MALDFAFIQTAPGRVFVGWGPFERLPFRRPDRPAFFITDFFLDEAKPWRHPATWEEIAIEELAQRLGKEVVPEIEWSPVEPREFAPLFESAQQGIARGDFQKIVPVVFEAGGLRPEASVWPYAIARLTSLPRGLYAYGCSIDGRSIAGAAPEILFQTHGLGYSTMALAGTRPISRAAELMRDHKELREHRFVVEDIARRLAPFGNVEIGALGIMQLPRIAHLVTPIFFRESGSERMSFAEMVRRLHPTAALGVWPRTEAGERWLREADRDAQRRAFGAPFGLEREGRYALALVGIRNIEWSGTSIRIGSGAGVIAESALESEFEELRQKREQVKALFGTGAAVEAWT
ncbi:MAG TPA: chorismate-binding protein [Thermoanaerobaculia bacterium]|nr:chorismate-binding protein [Thermoanaerobaculia bacterium]